MVAGRRGHDFRLLDALGDLESESFKGVIWRVVRKARSVIDSSRGSGRWNPRRLQVLYGAMEANGALAEIHYHMSMGQSVFPSRIEHVLYEVEIKSDEMLKLAKMSQLTALGIDKTRYGEMLYERSQEIADAAAFLGFDGLIVPSARWNCANVVLFMNAFSLEDLNVLSETDVDWKDWIKKNKS